MEYGGVSGGTMWGGVGGVYEVHGMGTWYEVSGVCGGTVWGGVGGIGGVWWIASGGVSGGGTLGDYIFPPLHHWTINSQHTTQRFLRKPMKQESCIFTVDINIPESLGKSENSQFCCQSSWVNIGNF